MKEVVLHNINGKYKIPRFIRFKIRKDVVFKAEHLDKTHEKEISIDNKELKQMSLLVEALNIKDKKERLAFVYDKSCELLDNDFYEKNLCEFKDNKCLHDRIHGQSMNGCCSSSDNSKKCPHLRQHRCTTKCLACKFHVCHCLREKGIKYKVNDIYLLKYLYNWKQKIMIYNNFFMTSEENLKDIYRNSIIYWALFSLKVKFIKNEDH